MAMKNELFKKHYARLCFEAGVRSALSGLAIGFAATFVLSALEWLLDFGASWLSVLVFVGISAVCGVIFYFLKYRPDMTDVARRLDRLGLDEQTTEILGIDVPSIVLPVCPGRNLSVVIEVAAMNNRQKRMGYNTAAEFNKRLMESMGVQ